MQFRSHDGESDRVFLNDAEYELWLDKIEPAIDAMYKTVDDADTIRLGTRFMGEGGLRSDGLTTNPIGKPYSIEDDRVKIQFIRIPNRKATNMDEPKRGDILGKEDLIEELKEYVMNTTSNQVRSCFTSVIIRCGIDV